MNFNFTSYILFLGLFFYMFGCGKSNFPNYSDLDRLRILALSVDQPSLQNPTSGTTLIQLTPYVSDIGGSGDLTLEVQSCLDPGIAFGASANCEGSPTASEVKTITFSSSSTNQDEVFGNPERTGAPQSGAIDVPLQVINNPLDLVSEQIKHNGLSYIITAKLYSNSNPNSTVRSFRRIIISTQSPNTNPSSNFTINSNGSEFVLPPQTGEYNLSVASSDTPEVYSFLTGNGEYKNLTENYVVTWFVSDGTIPSARSSMDEFSIWKLTSAIPPTRKFVIVAVLRDGRGGTAVKIKKL